MKKLLINSIDTTLCWSYTGRPNAKVVELVDTQGSGPCAREGVRVRVPSFAPWIRFILLVLFIALSGCSKQNKADLLLERSMEIFDEAIVILENNKGDQDKAEAGLRKFLSQNREEIRSLRKQGNSLLKAMPAEEHKSFNKEVRTARLERQNKAENLARGFKDPLLILSLIRLVN